MEILIFIIILYVVGWSVSSSSKSKDKTSKETSDNSDVLVNIFFIVAASVLFVIYVLIPIFSPSDSSLQSDDKCVTSGSGRSSWEQCY
jgi:cell division protein FtsW (lipid II flippase)